MKTRTYCNHACAKCCVRTKLELAPPKSASLNRPSIFITGIKLYGAIAKSQGTVFFCKFDVDSVSISWRSMLLYQAMPMVNKASTTTRVYCPYKAPGDHGLKQEPFRANYRLITLLHALCVSSIDVIPHPWITHVSSSQKCIWRNIFYDCNSIFINILSMPCRECIYNKL
jgi:hypothetical protein